MNILKQAHYFGHLTNLRQYSTIEEFIYAFEKIIIHTKGMIDSSFKESFITSMKEE